MLKYTTAISYHVGKTKSCGKTTPQITQFNLFYSSGFYLKSFCVNIIAKWVYKSEKPTHIHCKPDLNQIFTGLKFEIYSVRICLTAGLQIQAGSPTAKSFFFNRNPIYFNSAHSNLYFPPHTVSCSPLLSLRCPSYSAFELLIPIVMTSSGTWRRCLQCSGCLLKDSATSGETIKSGDRACCWLSSC